MALKSVESRNVEFRSNWRDEYLKVISAFANADGGKLMIAMNEKGSRKGCQASRQFVKIRQGDKYMKAYEYYAAILPDGHLSIPEKLKSLLTGESYAASRR